MEITEFITKFKGQLENSNVEILPETNYSAEPFWDSLTAMVIKVMIEDDYNVDVAPENMNKFKSISELFDYIKSQQ